MKTNETMSPTTEGTRKEFRLNIKCSAADVEMLEYMSRVGGANTSEVVRRAILFAYTSVRDMMEHPGMSDHVR